MIISQQDFQQLINQANNEEDYSVLVRKYLFHGTPFVFYDREGDYYEFRAAIASKWDVRFHDVLILGSAKLGYSYFKKTTFSIESDIDVSIVSSDLFEKYVKTVSDLQYQIDRGKLRMTQREMERYNHFLKYLVKGWMRPDLLPPIMNEFLNKDKWFEYFNSISYGKSQVGDYKIAAGLFKNYDYMEKYYVESLKVSKQ